MSRRVREAQCFVGQFLVEKRFYACLKWTNCLSVDPGPKERGDRGAQGHLPRQAEGNRRGDRQTGEEG